MGLANKFKLIFPVPRIPQKRYILLMVALLYCGVMFYVEQIKVEYARQALHLEIGIMLADFAAQDAQERTPDETQPAFGERS